MSWLSDFFKGGKNPADAAMPYLNQIPGMEKQYYDPFINYGKEAANTLTPQFNQMSQDPAAFLESIMSKYQPSRAYQLRNEEALRAAGNTAAAGGLRGSLGDIKNESRISDALLGQDMQEWLNNVLGIQKEGQQGLGHQFDTGFNATQGLTGDLSNVLGTQASLAFQGQANQNKSRSDALSGILQAIGGIAGFGFPNGSTVGGSIYNGIRNRFF
jgi:phage-related minor tail protein